MKQAIFLFLSLVSLYPIMTACTSSKANSADKQAKVEQITEKVESRDFTFIVNSVTPMRGKQIFPSSGYDLRIKNDSAYAYLPYFGVARSAPYGGGEGGIKFSEIMENYTITPNKKNNGWEIRFKVKAKDYSYDINMSVFNTGSSSINVNSNERDPISFYGSIAD